ncbi:hypothetical protein HYX17_02705 [Candidatus Woesearchaeota archaeon]|nr:hypothetical protein [Candidatus Woesearchaeota archaeon]
MEVLKDLMKDSNTHLNTADHLAYVSYSNIKDNKIIVSIADNLYKSLLKAVEAVLQYERMYKRIPPYSENFNAKLEMFKTKCAPRYNLDNEITALLDNLRGIVDQKKELMENGKEKFIAFNNEYKARSLTIEKVKEYLAKSKPFIQKVNEIIKEEYDRRIREY